MQLTEDDVAYNPAFLRTPVAAQLYRAVRDRVLSGMLVLGTRLVEETLGDEFGAICSGDGAASERAAVRHVRNASRAITESAWAAGKYST